MDEVLPIQPWQITPRSVLSPRHRIKSDRNYHVTFVEPTPGTPAHTRPTECSTQATQFIDEDDSVPASVPNGNAVHQDVGDKCLTLYVDEDDEPDDVIAAIPVRSPKKPRPLSVLSHDNPFVAESELQYKADYILTHSTINRTTLKIVDPDLAAANSVHEDDSSDANVNDVILGSRQATALQSSLPSLYGDGDSVKCNADLAVAEVQVVKSSPAEPLRAEEVKFKGMGKCCVVI